VQFQNNLIVKKIINNNACGVPLLDNVIEEKQMLYSAMNVRVSRTIHGLL